jgi:hypothetical protein
MLCSHGIRASHVKTRWQVVAPTGLAHATTADDEYEGFRIPKGATVWGNIK